MITTVNAKGAKVAKNRTTTINAETAEHAEKSCSADFASSALNVVDRIAA
jgi:hypothetical protein